MTVTGKVRRTCCASRWPQALAKGDLADESRRFASHRADIARLAAAAPLAGYRFEPLGATRSARDRRLRGLVSRFSVGSADCHFDECYYENEFFSKTRRSATRSC